MEIRVLSREEMGGVYKKHMKKDFPASELKPLEAMYHMLGRGKYLPLGLYDGADLIGYAYFAYAKEKTVALIDYLAICEVYRGRGIGNQLLQKIREYLQDWYGIILEVENPDKAESEVERQAQEHRIAFYQRNKVALTDVTLTLFGVPFRMMYLEGFELKPEEVEKYLKEIYHMMFPKMIYKRVVKF